MSVCIGPCTRARTAVFKESCRLRGPFFLPLRTSGTSWCGGHSASSQLAIETAQRAKPGDNYGSDLTASASKRKRDDLISKVSSNLS